MALAHTVALDKSLAITTQSTLLFNTYCFEISNFMYFLLFKKNMKLNHEVVTECAFGNLHCPG